MCSLSRGPRHPRTCRWGSARPSLPIRRTSPQRCAGAEAASTRVQTRRYRTRHLQTRPAPRTCPEAGAGTSVAGGVGSRHRVFFDRRHPRRRHSRRSNIAKRPTGAGASRNPGRLVTSAAYPHNDVRLEVETAAEDSLVRVVIRGEADAGNLGRLDTALSSIDLDARSTVRIDLSNLHFIDVPALRRLTEFRRPRAAARARRHDPGGAPGAASHRRAPRRPRAPRTHLTGTGHIDRRSRPGPRRERLPGHLRPPGIWTGRSGLPDREPGSAGRRPRQTCLSR